MEKLWAALFPPAYQEDAERELDFLGLKAAKTVGDLRLFSAPHRPLAWAAVEWRSVERLSFRSISEGAKALKPLARKWSLASGSHHRRSSLILEQLRARKPEILSFPGEVGKTGVGVFTLEDPGSLLYSLDYDRPYGDGRIEFREDPAAPSRAYLKLWEALTLAGRHPQPGERCLDLGSHPGGWTWVVARLGAEVLSIDRQPLDDQVARMPGVSFRKGDAFQCTPEKMDPVDWLFSDVICYPEKLLEFVQLWVEAGKARNMICTIKFQGPPDPGVLSHFQAIGRVVHLHHNKHELTWMRLNWSL
jgi:23S rRNA (cytidine2498-2'-O)-methyltransferase